MKVMKVITLATIALTMALTLILTGDKSSPPRPLSSQPAAAARVRVSRFLQQKEKEKERNPNAADHCKKDHDVCFYKLDSGRNATTCCNNKCVDLEEDDKNCGACKKKCDFTETCCRGECVLVAFDKRHCGECNHRCNHGGFCIYGMCDYA